MSAAWQPAHQPTAALVAAKLPFDRLPIRVPLVPDTPVDDAHQMRIPRTAAAGLVRRDENLRALQRRQSDVFDDVAVITNQHTDSKSVREVEDREFGAAVNRQVLERVQLAMPARNAIGQPESNSRPHRKWSPGNGRSRRLRCGTTAPNAPPVRWPPGNR